MKAVPCAASLLLVSHVNSAQDRPLAPAKPYQISCHGGGSTGTLQVQSKADFMTTDVVDFGLARADTSQRFAHVHYAADVGEDGFATALVPGLVAGAEYVVTARAHHRDASLGWNEKWSAVAAESATCRVLAANRLMNMTVASVDVKDTSAAGSAGTTWIEVFRYRGSGYTQDPVVTDYDLPDFLDNHNSGDANKQLSRWDFPGSEHNPALYSTVSYTRYCVEVLDVQLTVSTHSIGIGGPTKKSAFSSYLPCDSGKCHCANKFDAFCQESEIQSPRSWVDSNCPSGPGHCNCEEDQLSLSANYTGRWEFRPPFTDDAFMDSNGNPRCGWSEHSYPCHGDASPKGYFYHHPEGAKCKSHESVGDNGCTWKASPLMHTMPVQQLLDAGSIGGRPDYRKMQIDEELRSRDRGVAAFAQVGAIACGSMPTPTPSPPPSPPPSPSDCPGGDLASCIQECPAEPAVYALCVSECNDRCSDASSCTGGDDGADLESCVRGCPSDGFSDCLECCSGEFQSDILV